MKMILRSLFVGTALALAIAPCIPSETHAGKPLAIDSMQFGSVRYASVFPRMAGAPPILGGFVSSGGPVSSSQMPNPYDPTSDPWEVDGSVFIDGNADTVQLLVQGNATQTALPFVVENSAGTDQFWVEPDGTIGFVANAQEIAPADAILDVLGAVEILNGNNLRFAAAGAQIAIANGDSLTISDGTNTLFTFGDSGATGTLTIEGGATDLTLNGAAGTITGISASAVLTLDGNVGSRLAFGATHVSADGAKTWTNLGSGSGEATLGGTLNVNTTAVGNVDGGPDDLMTYALPANSLVTTGRGVHVYAAGSFANNANAKTLTCYVGTQAVLTHSPTVSVAGELWKVEFDFTRTGASTQDWTSEYRGNTGAAAAADLDPEQGTATQTETGALTVKCEATTATATNDIVQDYMRVTAF